MLIAVGSLIIVGVLVAVVVIAPGWAQLPAWKRARFAFILLVGTGLGLAGLTGYWNVPAVGYSLIGLLIVAQLLTFIKG